MVAIDGPQNVIIFHYYSLLLFIVYSLLFVITLPLYVRSCIKTFVGALT